MISVCVLVPLFNGRSTIVRTLESLLSQDLPINELVIIDNGSSDGSSMEVDNFFRNKRLKPIIIRKESPQGLARTYNEGIGIAKSELVVTLHQDVLLQGTNALELLVAPFKNNDDNVVASKHKVIHPKYIWNKYNFWQKCFFDRLLGREFSGIDGKFDCFSKKALAEVDFFDETHFRSAGEDGDIIYKLNKIGKIVDTDASIVHLHKNDLNFGIKDLFYKQAQYSEAQGALFRRGRINGIKNIARSFFREILVVSLFIPVINVMSAVLIIVYSFAYTKNTFMDKFNLRKLALPFINIGLLFISLIYSVKGFAYGKQRI